MTSEIERAGHLSFEQLCELADDPSSREVGDSWRAHLSACAECGAQLGALASLRAQTSALPREVTPPPELWAGIRAGIASRAHAGRSPRWDAPRWRFAAAALLIAASSSALTLVALRAREQDAARESTLASSASYPPRMSSRLPAHLASAEQGYARSVESLRRTLDERRDSLSSSTVETVERSLRIADAAIAEAREALERDPSNGLLVEIFTSNYERKIDLLRRATELAPRT